MAPLIGFDGTLQNSFLAKLEIKRDRNISLSMANSQITEIRSNEIVTGLGYKFKDVIPPFAKRFGWSLKSDLNLRLDVSFRRNQTVIRQVETALNQRTAGTNVVSIRFNADYTINQRLNLRIFYDRTINTPITTTFPTSNTNSGIQLRFTIAP
jgi:cell surface protein SprA